MHYDKAAMKVYKDSEHCVTISPFSRQGKRLLMVRVGLYIGFSPDGGSACIRTEQDFWKEVPAAFAAVNQPPVLDMGLPKPGAEVLTAGLCRAPGKKPVTAMELCFRVGPVRRRLAVFGDRERLPGGGLSAPLPFVGMPLTWDRAFGGPDFPANPSGMGLDGGNKAARQVPNVEDPENLVLNDDDRPEPACPLPVDVANPLRRALSGTYDKTWLETRWPALPDDVNPEFFYSAQPAQRLTGQDASDAPLFFRGDEDIEIIGMSHEHPHIRARLPEVRIRAFVTTTERFVPFAPARNMGETDGRPSLPYAKDLSREGVFREVDLHLDTVWLLPDLMGAYILRRGLLPVVDDEMDDVLRVLVVSENPQDEPHSLEYWREEQKKRSSLIGDIDFKPIFEAQAQAAKSAKKIRDLPKFLVKSKKEQRGLNPVFPYTPGDDVYQRIKKLAVSKAAVEAAERRLSAQREQFSHLADFTSSIESLSTMRASLEEPEKTLDAMLLQIEKELKKLPSEVTRNITSLEDLKSAVSKSVTAPEGAPLDAASLKTLAFLDNLHTDGSVGPPAGAGGREACFDLLAAAGRRLSREPALLHRLGKMGFDDGTPDDILPGYSPDACFDNVPAGLYVPRFEDDKLVALRIYPMDGDPARAEIRGLGADAGALVLIPGSDTSPLSLPASYPGGAVCIAPEDLSALFAEQEVGDFCHIVAAADPATLAGTAGLPPLLSDVPAEEGGLPLVVILPPDGEGRFAPWSAAYPAAVPLYLPEGCLHVLALAERGHRLRRLLLNCLPPHSAAMYDFDFPIPDNDPPDTFTFNVPVPTREEIEKRAAELLGEVYEPEEEAAAALLNTEQDEAAYQAAVVEMLQSRMADKKAEALAAVQPEEKEKLLAEIGGLDEQAKQLEAMRKLTRGEVEAMLADGCSLEGRNLQGLDLAGLDFSGVSLKQALCGETDFSGCRMEGADFTSALVNGANFSGASLRGAVLKLITLQKAVLRGTDLSETRIELANFDECDAAGAVFDRAEIQLANFSKAVLDKARFEATSLSLCNFNEIQAHETDFRRCRAFKCVFMKSDLAGALFQESTLNECLFQGVSASGLSFAGSDLRKFYSDMDTDLSGADFTEADLREASLRLTRLPGAEFYGSNPENAQFIQCDLSHARLDGLRGTGCRFIKCDMTGADISGTDLYGGALRKCRLDGADLTGANLFAANLRGLVIDPDTRFDGATLKRTLPDGKEEELLRQQHGKS
jgi:uncharacterized protein YjbI with pentapeptide repeats